MSDLGKKRVVVTEDPCPGLLESTFALLRVTEEGALSVSGGRVGSCRGCEQCWEIARWHPVESKKKKLVIHGSRSEYARPHERDNPSKLDGVGLCVLCVVLYTHIITVTVHAFILTDLRRCTALVVFQVSFECECEKKITIFLASYLYFCKQKYKY